MVERVQPGRLIAALPGGERVRLLAAHRQMCWNPVEYDAFRADVRRGDTVLDVGANIGAYTALFAQWVGDTGRVIAFEPAPTAYAALCGMLQANGLSSRVTALQQAVSDREGSASFTAHGDDGGNRLCGPGAADAVTVATTTIDGVCQRLRLRPRLMKIDVEGAELDVLRGARATIAAADDLRLYMEIHPRLWASFGASREALEAELQAQRLRPERLDGDPDVWGLEGVCLRLVRCGS